MPKANDSFDVLLEHFSRTGMLVREEVAGYAGDPRTLGRIGELLRRLAAACEAGETAVAGEISAAVTLGTVQGKILLARVQVSIGSERLAPDVPIK